MQFLISFLKEYFNPGHAQKPTPPKAGVARKPAPTARAPASVATAGTTAKSPPSATAQTPVAKPAVSAKPVKKADSFFGVEAVRVDIVQDEDGLLAKHDRLIGIIQAEALVIAILAGILILGLPFFHPIYRYYALNPEQKVMQITGLTMPNMTNRAVLSWSTTAITELMTMGFGDYEAHIKGQRFRFTEEGWESFATAFDRQKIGESFKQHQLVLTTVPSNTPVILGQGVNPKHVYQWIVQMPIIMTFATNNNVSRRQTAVITLTIVRVPSEQNPAGIGIENWYFNN